MEDKIKELLLKYWMPHFDKTYLNDYVFDVANKMKEGMDSFSLALWIRANSRIEPDYDLVKGLEQIKQQFKQ